MPLSRLIKTRSKVNVVELNEIMEEERPPRFSIADLQSRRVVTTQRQLLHRQFSDTYAETLRSSALLDGSQPYLNRAVSSTVLNQQIDKPSSPVASPEASIDLVRPFGAPTGKIDIEQAINLLQELKKTASPEELVSLHRALLPVKEVSPIYSPQIASAEDSMFSTAIPPERRRTVMPPGLATRSGLFEDVLRKPQSCATVHTASKERREMWVHGAQTGAGDKQNGDQDKDSGQPNMRPETPSEQPNTGAYHRGTLRITNGTASPDPSIVSKIAARERIANLQTSVDLEFGQLIWPSERPRPSGPRYPQQQPGPIENAGVEANGSQRRRSASASDPSPETSRASFDHANSVPASPLKARFQHRWSHRAAHLSQQYLKDCEIGGSPFDEKTAPIELMKRRSLVPDVESDDSSQHMAQHAHAICKLTDATIDTDGAGSEVVETQALHHVPEHIRLDPPTRPLKKVDSGYQSDAPNSPHQQPDFHGTTQCGESSALSFAEPQTTVQEKNDETSGMERTLLLGPASVHTLGETMTSPRTDAHLADIQAKRSSPLAFLRRNRVSERGSVSSLSDVMATSVHSRGLPPPGLVTDHLKQPKKLQKRAPKSVRHRSELEAELQTAVGESMGSTTSNETKHSRTKSTPARSQMSVLSSEDGQAATPDTTDDGTHRFRLRGKSFGRKRSKTNSTEPSNAVKLQTPPLRTRVRRSISASSHINVFSDNNHGTSCMSSGGQRQQSLDRVCPDSQTVVRSLSSHPPYTSPDSNQISFVPKSVHGCLQPCQDSTAITNTPQPAPPDVPMPKSPPRATLEGYERVIPIGANGSVEDLFPGWQSRPAASPSPMSTPSPSHLQVRQSYKPRSPLSNSSIPPLPELPADIESKLSRTDQMLARKMLNSPRNSARNSPLSSVRNSDDSTSAVKRRPANRLFAVQDDDNNGTQSTSKPTRWSVDGSIPLPQAGGKSQPASPTHDSQHPGWPGWEKQADLWRQRKIDMGHALNRSVDMVGKILVESESSPKSSPLVVSRHGNPLGVNDARNVQLSPERDSPAEQLVQAYTYLFTDDKENWPAQQSVQRTDSVDSSATMSSEDHSAMLDISRNGSAYSSASSNPSADASPSPMVKPATYASNQSFTPYRATDAVQAERSRALSRASRTCNIPPGSLYLVQSQNASMPQMRDASVLDRYSGGLGYGWDRSTGFGGSAGTLSSGTESVNRKSVKISEDYGLDLSDVPVFLRKAHTGHF